MNSKGNLASLPTMLILSGALGDTRRYRTLHLYQQCRLAGIPALLSHITDPALPKLVERADIVVLHRVSHDAYVQKLLDRAGQRGALILADTDDLIFDPDSFQYIDSPDFQDRLRARMYLDDMQRMFKTMQACQGVLCSTSFLKQRVEAAGLPAWKHANAFSLEMLHYSRLAEAQAAPQKQAHSGTRLIIGYASGTPTHNQDFQLISAALQEVMSRNLTMELWIIGALDLHPSWNCLAGRVRRIPRMSWRKLPETLAQLDINLAPLVAANPFTQSKSEIKYMEAALVRTATLASPTAAFSEAIRSDVNGLLAKDAEAWQSGLEALSDARLRQELASAAYQSVADAYHPQKRSLELIDTLNKICENSGKDGLKISLPDQGILTEADERLWWDPHIEEHPTRLEQGIHSLRARGAGYLARQTLVYFRRMISPVAPYRPKAGERRN